MEIKLYEDWMKSQVSVLFSQQYNVSVTEFSNLINDFYEHPYQKNKSIRIVATEGKKVIGFQSFFYWPYILNGIIYNSYQSGNSLVHPEYRGKGIFQKLLSYLDNHKAELNIDFLIGFPIIDSKNSLLRNNWQNLFNLQWYLKLVNPFSIIFPVNKFKVNEVFPNTIHKNYYKNDSIRLSSSSDFLNWRRDYSKNSEYIYFNYSESEKIIQFQMKIVLRKKIIKELQIGDINTNASDDIKFIENSLNALSKNAKKLKFLTIITIALNEHSDQNLIKCLLNKSYKRTNKSIFFMIKPFIETNELLKLNKWVIYRSDIDTW